VEELTLQTFPVRSLVDGVQTCLPVTGSANRKAKVVINDEWKRNFIVDEPGSKRM
jgi:hypothetical protein